VNRSLAQGESVVQRFAQGYGSPAGLKSPLAQLYLLEPPALYVGTQRQSTNRGEQNIDIVVLKGMLYTHERLVVIGRHTQHAAEQGGPVRGAMLGAHPHDRAQGTRLLEYDLVRFAVPGKGLAIRPRQRNCGTPTLGADRGHPATIPLDLDPRREDTVVNREGQPQAARVDLDALWRRLDPQASTGRFLDHLRAVFQNQIGRAVGG